MLIHCFDELGVDFAAVDQLISRGDRFGILGEEGKVLSGL